ncbi:MAG: hypothetical protein GY774_36135 [Planctomycetes bacterium]|nr:hypothetical protein [Planctomycetota bacterium]
MKKTIFKNLTLALLIAVVPSASISLGSEGVAPIADAGLPRFAAENPVVLDGTGSYDPDNSGLLSYTWRQISGPSVIIIDANSATPTIAESIQPGKGRDKTPKPVGLIPQTDEVQECEFELVVTDGELMSLPDTVKVIIVPDFGADTLWLQNPPFDPNKPTLIYFGGGNCITGGGSWSGAAWTEKANVISFPSYGPDSGGVPRTYYKYGDMIIVYLSAAAPNYNQPIQTSGYSTGGQPAVDVGIHLNLSYADARYAVNRVTFFDSTPYCRDYSDSITAFLGSSVDGEQCWADAYVCTTERPGWAANPPHYEANYPPFYENVLNVWLPTATGGWVQRHGLAQNWYRISPTDSNKNNFNHGVVAGPYWSVIGPGKNLQLASTPDAETYKFEWYGDASSGYMDLYDESNHPGRLPEPVTLLAYSDALYPNDEPTSALFTCKESENAVGYQLLLGSEPYRVMDFNIVSDTPSPPSEIISTFPFEETFWTVRAYDQYGSTIYADPILVNLENMSPIPVDNLTNSKRYGYIQIAINDADPGDEIVVRPGVYRENISFEGKNLTLRSTDPNNSAVVAATIIESIGDESVVTFSGGEGESCVLSGFTITGGNTENGGGIYCGDNSTPTITNCAIMNNSAINSGGGMYTDFSSPNVLNCIFSGNSAQIGGGVYCISGSTTITNCTFAQNTAFWASGIFNFVGSPVLTNCIFWNNSDPEIEGSVATTYSDIRGGWAGEGNIDADPLFADPENGDFHLLTGSPCIDAGDPATSVGLEPLPNGGIINMGAYGGTSEASKSP